MEEDDSIEELRNICDNVLNLVTTTIPCMEQVRIALIAMFPHPLFLSIGALAISFGTSNTWTIHWSGGDTEQMPRAPCRKEKADGR